MRPVTTLEADVNPERQLDENESEVLTAYEAGELVSVATKDELDKLRAAARATGMKDRRVSFGCRWPTGATARRSRGASRSRTRGSSRAACSDT
jgi:uncharacterized protein YggE